MAIKRMLIDSSHAEETRVVVAAGNRLDEFDFETSTRKQLKGNIYLAKVTRVEPSLQAAFVDFGGNRHGFLPFSEIHPDYYQIPLADREALFREQEEAAEQEDDEDEAADAVPADTPDARSDDRAETSEFDALPEEIGGSAPPLGDDEPTVPYSSADSSWDEPGPSSPGEMDAEPSSWASAESPAAPQLSRAPDDSGDMETDGQPALPFETGPSGETDEPSRPTFDESPFGGDASPPAYGESNSPYGAPESEALAETTPTRASPEPAAREPGGVEEVGGDEIDDAERRRAQVSRSLLSRRYKIQQVIKKRQIMLVQVVKEERGTKGAALTTYLSLAGRYCVLMPNAIRGGGISRKIVNAEDRRRLKSITSELEVPGRMGLIVRTAGMNRTKAEIKRDFEYLLRQWESIRDLTLGSTAPCLIYGEANLIRRSIRDLYAKDIEEILVEGEEGYRIAKDFMRTLIPSHTAKVQPYRDRVPLFVRYQIESQLDSMYSPQVQLRSGGYLVINQTEALVAIDVNSGRATKERNIEETAFRTNLEAADEVARQLRLRDLAGLIVIDFIDMEEGRNQRAVERRLKDALKSDRARIQVGRISAFGLLEMSRQRLRPSLAEASMEMCAACGGTGMMRSTESAALHALRAIEEEGLRGRASEIRVHVPGRVAMYILNNKRQALADIEARYAFLTSFLEDNTLVPPGHEIERIRARGEGPPVELRGPQPITAETTEIPAIEEEEPAVPEEAPEPEDEPLAAKSEGAGEESEEQREHGRRRRRRKRGGRGFDGAERAPRRHDEAGVAGDEAHDEVTAAPDREFDEAGEEPIEPVAGRPAEGAPVGEEDDEAARAARRRRRGRRGGRRRRGRGTPSPQLDAGAAEAMAEQPDIVEGAAGEIAKPGDETDDGRGRRRRRRGRRGRIGEAPAASAESAGYDEDFAPAPVEPSGPSEPASWAAGPPPAGDDIRLDADRLDLTGTASEPSASAQRAEEPPATGADEMEAPPSGFAAGEEPAGEGKPQSSGSTRRGWWQRVLTGR